LHVGDTKEDEDDRDKKVNGVEVIGNQLGQVVLGQAEGGEGRP